MAVTPGPKPEIVNAPVNEALAKAKANPSSSAVWELVRQLGQGTLTVASTVPKGSPSPLDPTSLPGDLAPNQGQSVLAMNTDKVPVLVAFTARNVGSLLPQDSTGDIVEQILPAVQVAQIAAKEPYVGLLIDPGSENGFAVPGDFLRAGLPAGHVNFQAKELLSHPGLQANPGDPGVRMALVQALAKGAIYTAVEKGSLEAGSQPKFPLIPMKPVDPSNIDPQAEAAILFGTSPAEIFAAFNPDQWSAIPVRMNEVVNQVRQNANLKMVVINPAGPTLQLPISGPAPTPDAAVSEQAAAGEELLNEPTPEPGESTEPDAGTREGED